jgi:hypothetical protein
MSYTENQTERWELVGRIEVASHSTEQNSGRLDVAPYTRLKVEVFGADGGANDIDVDCEEADAASGGTLQSLHGGDFDVALDSAEYMRVIEIRSEQFTTNSGFRWFNLEITPAGARVCGAHIWGLVKDAPADTTNLAGVTYVQEGND